ncbi:MAG: hypothetical protein JWO48_1664 [Bryobacterales bacterium]|nr:hypothetical protein [Bryobacterales bacterium]
MILERIARTSPSLQRLLSIAAAAVLLQAGAPDARTQARFVPVQSTRTNSLAAGKFLVATRDLLDPNFAETVVLLVRYDEDSVLGLIINRRTKVPIARAFPELPESTKGRSDPIYAGGPVERAVALALLRGRARPEGAEPVFADVSMVSSKSLLERTMRAGTGPGTFRLYSGYSGWTAEQLQREVDLGGWYIFEGDAAMVFDPDPESLWSRLIRKTEQRVALGLPNKRERRGQQNIRWHRAAIARIDLEAHAPRSGHRSIQEGYRSHSDSRELEAER